MTFMWTTVAAIDLIESIESIGGQAAQFVCVDFKVDFQIDGQKVVFYLDRHLNARRWREGRRKGRRKRIWRMQSKYSNSYKKKKEEQKKRRVKIIKSRQWLEKTAATVALLLFFFLLLLLFSLKKKRKDTDDDDYWLWLNEERIEGDCDDGLIVIALKWFSIDSDKKPVENRFGVILNESFYSI